MYSFWDIANSNFLKFTVFGGLFIILTFIAIFTLENLKYARKLGISSSDLKKLTLTTIYFSIIPSIAILIGLFAIYNILGGSWGLFRLSVIGSVMYETVVAMGVVTNKGLSTIPSDASGSMFVEIMFVTSLCITSGVFASVFMCKSVHKRISKPSIDKGLSIVINSSFMTVFVTVYAVQFLVEAFMGSSKNSIIPLLVMLTSTFLVFFIQKLSKQLHMLKNFTTPLGLLGGMFSAVLWSSLLI